MNRVLIGLLQTIVRSLAGALTYERLYLLVEDAEKSGKPGAEKKALVKGLAVNIAEGMDSALLSLVIRVAIYAIRNKA